jgi:adenylosuccinate synthase
VSVRQAGWLNGFTSLGLTKLDVLDGYDHIKVCVAYEYKGKFFEQMPDELEVLSNCRPHYVEMTGWQASTVGMTTYEQLPAHARAYIEELSQRLELPVSVISTGSGREHSVLVRDPFADHC